MSNENARFFQWVVGDRRGEVVVFDKIVNEDGLTFIEFKDNSRINVDLVAEINQKSLDGKMMAEVDSPNNVWRFREIEDEDNKPRVEQDWESQVKYEVPSVEDLTHADLTENGGTVNPRPKKKKIELIPPIPTTTKFGKIANSEDMIAKSNESITSENKIEQTSSNKPSASSDDPVYIMMEKAKKVDTEVNMTLTISLPSKRLFEVAAESFDNGDKKALDYIIDNIDISEIKESLKMGIAAMYGEVHLSEVGNIVDNIFPKDDPVVFNKSGNFESLKDIKDHTMPSDYFSEPEAVEEPIIEAGIPQGDPSIIDLSQFKSPGVSTKEG